MTIHFSCTTCGKCCHNLRLPLSVDESVAWLKRGGTVQAFCEAIPWPVEPPVDDGPAHHKRERSFAAVSGVQPVRIILTLVAAFDGACPHLRSDMLCGAYEERPRVCRIYPAEVNPFITLDPPGKACPPEAWSSERPVFMMGSQLIDAATRAVIRESHAVSAQDAKRKGRLAALLGCRAAALANEGFVIYSFDSATALAALETVVSETATQQLGEPQREWEFVSNQGGTIDTLTEIRARVSRSDALDRAPHAFLPFLPDSFSGATVAAQTE